MARPSWMACRSRVGRMARRSRMGRSQMGRSRMAWRSQMGRVLVGWSLVGRLWNRSLLGVYPRWFGTATESASERGWRKRVGWVGFNDVALDLVDRLELSSRTILPSTVSGGRSKKPIVVTPSRSLTRRGPVRT
jgi:hypothetical protein